MAQSENYFGLRRGSTKTATYTVRHGKQITKDRVTAVTNPQTSEQMSQRIKVPIVAQASSILHDLINHSFEGISYGEQSINEFRSANLKKGELTILSYVPKGAQDCGEADYIVSRGSLMAPDLTSFGVNGGNIQLADLTIPQSPEDEFPYSQDEFTNLAIGTVFPNKLIRFYTQKYMVCSYGDQLTFLIGKHGQTYTWQNKNKTLSAKRHSFVVGRIVFAEDNAITARWKLIKQYKYDDEGVTTQEAVFSDGYMCISIDYNPEEPTLFTIHTLEDVLESHANKRTECMQAVIRSQRATNNLWLRSTSRLVVGNSQKITADDVLDTYLKTSSNSTQYLNSGVDGVGIVGGAT